MKKGQEHNMLEKEGKVLFEQNVPFNLDDQILIGIDRGRRHKNRMIFAKNSILSVTALLILFVLSVNFFPSVNQLASKIPGINKIAEAVDFDRGLQEAISNEYIQVVNQSDTKGDMTITIDQLIVDEKRLILFYNVETDEDVTNLRIGNIKLTNKNGQVLNDSFSSSGDFSLNKNQIGVLDVRWDGNVELTDPLTITFSLIEDQKQESGHLEPVELPETFTYKLPIDLSKMKESKTYTINKTAELDGQKLHFKKVISYPTREELHLEYDENNTKDILSWGDLQIVNENGDVVSKPNMAMTDGATKTQVISFTSNYFAEYEELYFTLTKMNAIDKSDNKIVIDLEEEKLLKAPDNRVTLAQISEDNSFDLENKLAITFLLDAPPEEDQSYFVMSGVFTDVEGKEFYFGRQQASSNDFTIYIENQEYANPISFSIQNYPTYIEGDVKIKIK
ncbi:hypothetical protein HNQ94_003922 [Salirhabdus euzebyi]|uniref:DUF4179 domain-containing protein n=1 Tax=Salirhabdus euzebyi TaxID=394506 RepID=A0A841QB44_9BACI|nr:DUF4179 domain-containing protein [Salirhabdus euzebyi]MBB6455422.1 hypothetical protein [Salirhabdus euzebyi]